MVENNGFLSWKKRKDKDKMRKKKKPTIEYLV